MFICGLSVLWLSSLCCLPPSLSCGCPLYVAPSPPLSCSCSLVAVLFLLPPFSVFRLFSYVAPLLCLPAVLLCCPSPLSVLWLSSLCCPPLFSLCSHLPLSCMCMAVLFCCPSLPAVLLCCPPSLSCGCPLCATPLCHMAVSLDITICPPPSRLMPALPPVPIAIGGCLVNLVNLQYMI